MSYSNAGADRLTKNARREAAREKAKKLRNQQRRKERRNRFFIQSAVIVAAIAIIGIVFLVITSSVRPPAAGPSNMASDGILIGQDLVAVSTPAIAPGELPTPNVRDETSSVISIQVFLDYMCIYCAEFEQTNAEQIKTLVASGAATVEIFPFSILDRASQGTNYSTRAANAAACVANYSPNQFYDFNSLMFDPSIKPAENSTGLTDAQLIAVTNQANVESADSIANCIEDQRFAGWVKEAHDRHLANGVPNSNVTTVTSTPTIIVNGVQYTGAINDPNAFRAFVLQAANTNFTDNATPTPTPVP